MLAVRLEEGMHAFVHQGKNRHGSIYTHGYGYTLPIDTIVERLKIRPRLLPIGSRRHETLIAWPTRSNIRDEEDGKHMSYVQGSDLSKGIPCKAPAHPRIVRSSRLSMSLCISGKQTPWYNMPVDANTY
jgi:hypothetical protein